MCVIEVGEYIHILQRVYAILQHFQKEICIWDINCDIVQPSATHSIILGTREVGHTM